MKRVMIGISVVMGLLLCISANSYAATYYVSPTSTSTNWATATNINTPCTVQTAFDNAQAGDTVQFRGGLYKIPANTTGDWLSGYYAPNHSGTENARIVFMAYPGETPVFDGTSGGIDKDGHGYGHFARIMSNTRYIGSGSKTYHEYITFDGFTFQCDGGLNEGKITLTGGDNSSSKPRVRGLIVQNCTFNGGTWDNEARVGNSGTGDNHEGIFVSQTTGLIIRNCRIFDYASANHNMNTSAIKTYHSDNMIIEHCEIYDSTQGIYSKSNTDSLTVRYCYIHDNNVGFYAGSDGWWNDANDHSKGYFVIENSDNVLYHNVFSNNIRGTINGFTQGGCDLDGFTAYNNTIYGTAGYTVSVGLGSGERQNFYNNILYGPKIDSDVGLLKWYCGNNNAQDVAEGMAEFNFGLESADHNQFGDLSGNFLIRVKKPNESTVSYSTVAAWKASGVLTGGRNPGDGDLASNPLFVNASGTMTQISDFALGIDSPCKGTGRGGVDMGADVSRVGIQVNHTDTETPSVPAGLVGTASGTSVNLSWTASQDNIGVSGYRIFRDGNAVRTTAQNRFTDIGLTRGQTYRYCVSAYDAAGNESARSEEINVTIVNHPPVLTAIGNKTGKTGTALSFTVAATDLDNDPLTYTLTGGPSGAIFNASTRTFTWTSTANQVGVHTNIRFQVSDGSLTDDETITITVSDGTAPATPGNLQANTGSSTQINLSWNAVTDNVGVVGYRINRNGDSIGTTTQLNYNDAGLIPGTTYTYRVEAYDGAGNRSGLSNTATAVTSSGLGVTPSRQYFSANGGKGEISVIAPTGTSWSVTNVPAWVTVKTNSGSGNGTIEYTVAVNDTEVWREGTFTVNGTPVAIVQQRHKNPSGLGLYDPANHQFFLWNGLSGTPQTQTYSTAQNSWLPITGDWDGNGTVTPGFFDQATHTFHLWNTPTGTEISFSYGDDYNADLPVSGDWDGDGSDSVGLYNPATQTFRLTNTNGTGASDDITVWFRWTDETWLPLVGDWDGNGVDTVGLYVPEDGAFFLKNSHTGEWADVVFVYGPAESEWLPVVGDWDGDQTTGVGLYDPLNKTIHLRNTVTSGADDTTFVYSSAGTNWIPISGDWDGQ